MLEIIPDPDFDSIEGAIPAHIVTQWEHAERWNRLVAENASGVSRLRAQIITRAYASGISMEQLVALTGWQVHVVENYLRQGRRLAADA